MFLPFSGWLFNPDTVPDPGKATSPPYDVMSAADRGVLLARSPHNIVRLLPPGPDGSGYAGAASLLDEWRAKRVLIRDETPRFYLYQIDHADDTGTRRIARGVIGALQLLPMGRDVVPHEETIGSHRAGPTSIVEATRANLDPIMALSAAPRLLDLLTASIGARRLAFEAVDGSVHRLFDLSDPNTIRAIETEIGAHPVSIADGHHRYTTALRYRKRRAKAGGAGPWDYIMTMVAPTKGSGLTIGPYHRLLPPFDFDPDVLSDAFVVVPGEPVVPDQAGSLVVVGGGTAFHLEPRPDALTSLPAPWQQASTAVARELLYPRLGITEDGARYLADAAEAVAAAVTGPEMAILVAPITERAVADAGELGLRFPTKTTYFTPKPRTGLVLRCFQP